MDRYTIKTRKDDISNFERLVTFTLPIPGEMLMILGREEEFREETESFKRYIKDAPIIRNNGKVLEYGIKRNK